MFRLKIYCLNLIKEISEKCKLRSILQNIKMSNYSKTEFKIINVTKDEEKLRNYSRLKETEEI